MIAVFGSANIDLVLEAERIPRPGETVAARRLFSRYPGGKGANQAIAAARLGAEVSFFGKVGDDGYGSDLLRTLSDDGIDVASVVRAEFHSGIALITVSPEGENAIVYLAGANGSIDRSYVDSVIDRLASAEILLLQLEVPLPAIAYLLESLPEGRPLVILDPAPARDISSRERPLHEALRWAVIAGSLATMKKGGEPFPPSPFRSPRRVRSAALGSRIR